jgi:hypothetical protein
MTYGGHFEQPIRCTQTLFPELSRMLDLPRRTIRCLLASLPLLVSCRALTEPLLDQGQVDHVNVSTWPGVVEAGDTITATADGFTANGILTAWTATRAWSVSDSSMIQILGTGASGRVLLRALRTGLVRVSARIGDREGGDSLRVIPPLAPITFTPAVVSIHRGDSVRVNADIRSAAGEPVTGVLVLWNTNDIGVVSAGCCSPSVWLRTSTLYGAPGTTTVTATVAHTTGSLRVTVVP